MRLTQRRRLDVASTTWSIDCITQVRGNNKVSTDVSFSISSVDLGHTFQTAIERARAFAGQPATIDGAAVRALWLDTAELTFGSDGSERIGDLTFRASLAAPFALPFDLNDTELVAALRAAHEVLGSPIRADAISVTDRYYVARIYSIGTLGAFVDRRTGVAHIMGSPLPEELWMWGYERGLLDEPAGDVVIEGVADPSRALTVNRFARVRSSDFESLPLVLPGCATWLAILPLHEAGDALTWRVRRGV